jgi:hypothetical protein
MFAVYGLGATELLIFLILFLFFLPAVAVGVVLWVVFKGRNRNPDRIDIVESRLERLERQLDRQSEPTVPKTRE